MIPTDGPVKVDYEDGHLSIGLSGEIDHHSARPLREKIDRQLYLYHPSECTLSLRGVDFMDSAGLGLILGRLAVCRQFSCPMRLTGADARMLRIFRMAGIARMEGLTVDGLERGENVKR